MSAVRVPGVEITLGGTVYVVPPLNVASIKQHRDQVGRFFTGGVPDIELVATLLHAALARNYPDIKIELIEDVVDYANMIPIMDAIMHSSGLAQKMGELGRRITGAMTAPSASIN